MKHLPSNKKYFYKGNDAMLQKYNQNKAVLQKLLPPVKGQVEVLAATKHIPMTIHISMNEISIVHLEAWPKDTIYIIDEIGEVPWEQLAILQEALKNEASNSKKLGILVSSMNPEDYKVGELSFGPNTFKKSPNLNIPIEIKNQHQYIPYPAQQKFMQVEFPTYEQYLAGFNEMNNKVTQTPDNEIKEPVVWKKAFSQKLKDLLISVCAVGKALWMNDKELFVRNLDMMRADFDELERMVEKD